MSKGKYKRKREHHQSQPQKLVSGVGLQEHQQHAADPEEGRTAGPEKKEPSMGLGKRLKHWRKSLGELWGQCSLTDRIIAIFTVVLAVAAIYQFIIMGSQLDTMRKDQRPWIKLSFTSSPTGASVPIGGIVEIVNNGKTPARGKVTADFVVEKIKNGDEPTFDYPQPHAVVIMGMIPPNDKPQSIYIERKQLAADGKTVESDPLTPDEFRDFTDVKIFFIAYGTIHYSDFFGRDHWTTFCNWMTPPTPPSGTSVSASRCSKYADVDQN